MGRIVGFTAHAGLSTDARVRAERSQRAALRHFPWIEEKTEVVGGVTLAYWGVEPFARRLETSTGVFLFVGSPSGSLEEDTLWRFLVAEDGGQPVPLPWDGRILLVGASLETPGLRIWTDWLGSIPVYRFGRGNTVLASTLEPVAAATLPEKRLSAEGLGSLLINGHYEGHWTLSADVTTTPPDSRIEWGGGWKTPIPRDTVTPSSERLDNGWESLIEELDELTAATCRGALAYPGLHIIPLSSGMDSRLAAALAKDQVQTKLATYGVHDEMEVVYARQVARSLRLPWRAIDLGTSYLRDWTRLWADWFGCAMHFHGMYQVPFLSALATEQAGPLVHGYMGDPLAGNHIAQLDAGEALNVEGAPLSPNWGLWSASEIKALVHQPMNEAFESLLAARRQIVDALPGARYKGLMLLDAWVRQRLLISYQPLMYDYWRGVSTPFLSADYANFWLSLPRSALEDRRLQKAMLMARYPALAAIAGTFSTYPLLPTEAYVIKRAIATRIPPSLRRGPFREFHTPHRSLDSIALKDAGADALWPLHESRHQLAEIVDLSIVDATERAAFEGDVQAYLKLSALQPLALWLQR